MTRILIVEDEAILRQGILALVNWKQLNCEIAGDFPNGMEAVKFLNTHDVDLVVTDIKMPGMSGLELAEFVSRSHPETGVILLSAYSDFEFAQQAIRLGICSYVLKNNFIRDLPAAVLNAVEKMNARSKASAQPNFPSVDETHMNPIIIKSILDGSLQDAEEIRRWFACYHLPLNNYFIILAEIDNTEQENFTRIPAKFTASVQKFIHLAFKDYSHLCVSLSDNSLFILVDFAASDQAMNLRSLVTVCSEILSTVKSYMTFDLNLGISSQFSLPSAMKEAGKEAQYALNRIFFNTGIALYQDVIHQRCSGPIPDVQKNCEIILNDLSSHDEQALKKHLEEVFKEYQNCINNLENLKIQILLLGSVCFRRLTDNNIHISNSDDMENGFTLCITRCQSPNSIHKVVERTFHKIIQLDLSAPAHYNHLVVQVNNFIRANYKLPVKLEDMARLLHVNSSYLSRVYKKESGDSIITALNKYRIEKAKDLLKSGEYLVSEVGYRVGIEDPAYFTNVFTKYAGTSPKNYRSQN